MKTRPHSYLLSGIIAVFLTLFTFTSCAQNVFKVVTGPSKRDVPFAVIKSGDKSLITNIKGETQLAVKENQKLIVRAPFHLKEDFTIDRIQDTIVLELTLTNNQITNFLTIRQAQQIKDSVITHSLENEPLGQAPFSYQAYNKFFLSTDKIEETTKLLKKALHFFSFKLKDFKGDHYLMLSESISRRTYLDPEHEEEVILSSKVSGTDKPMLITVNSQMQTLSAYGDFIKIAGTDYVNPIAPCCHHKYHFEFLDKVNINGRSILVVKFNPKSNARFESLMGYLYIDTENYAIRHAVYRPAIESDVIMEVNYSCSYTNGKWFPEAFSTVFDMPFVAKGISFYSQTLTTIDDVKFEISPSKSDFDEIAIRYEHLQSDTTDILDRDRPRNLSKKEENTYIYYDTVGTLKNFERIIAVGERLYFKKVPYKIVDIDLTKFGTYNQYEGLRIGVGGETNEKLSQHFQLGGYVAYGLLDKFLKYGASASFILWPEKELRLKVGTRTDVDESARNDFAFDEHQYSSESLRDLNLRVMDKILHQNKLSISMNPIPYFRGKISYSQSVNEVTYDYEFNGSTQTRYNYNDITFDLHYSYGQRYFKLINEKFAFTTRFPKLWLQFNKGWLRHDGNDYTYQRVQLQGSYFKVFPGLGKTGIHLDLGLANAELPYYKLYNGIGSRNITTVTHNAFETMAYNEFLSNQFAALFVSHDFGYTTFLNWRNFRPRAEVAFNMGWGRLNNPEIHSGREIKTMEKGYFEAGFLINDLFVVSAYGIKAGFGIGAYNRFGQLALEDFGENTVIKVSTTFKL